MSENILVENNATTENRTVPKLTDAPLFPFWIDDRGLSFFLVFLVLVQFLFPWSTCHDMDELDSA